MPLAHLDLAQLEGAEDIDQPPVFVYGSLRHGQENYGLLRGKTLAEIPAVLYGVRMFSLGWYPVITEVAGDSDAVVTGELMIIHPRHYSQTLKNLDLLEGYDEEAAVPTLYSRLKRCIKVRSGREVMAWVYIGSEELVAAQAQEAVPTGDWVQWRRDRLAGLRGF
ncbi:MAG: gamma-glutamylcyclotransferase family protein [Anaerolineae bacterium]|nr:gamma-glutamylcyclotransferase [Anaerolineae bacterium]